MEILIDGIQYVPKKEVIVNYNDVIRAFVEDFYGEVDDKDLEEYASKLWIDITSEAKHTSISVKDFVEQISLAEGRALICPFCGKELQEEIVYDIVDKGSRISCQLKLSCKHEDESYVDYLKPFHQFLVGGIAIGTDNEEAKKNARQEAIQHYTKKCK